MSSIPYIYGYWLMNGKDFVLTTALNYNLPKNSARFTVPAYTTTDFASVPALFRPAMSVVGRHNYADVLHDYLRRTSPPSLWAHADSCYLECLAQCGVPYLRRTAIYLAVRAHALYRTTFPKRS